jgi:hypothetical protein
MFEGWSDFFLMVGSAAAVLIGLIFVVISLMQGRSRSSVLAGSRIYMGPIILGVSFMLVVAAAALTPDITPAAFAIVTGIVAGWGLVRGVISTLGIRALRGSEDPPHWTDAWYYGRLPCVVYMGLMIAAVAVWRDLWWGKYWLAAIVIAGLLLAIRNEWDLITWIAPRGDSTEQ